MTYPPYDNEFTAHGFEAYSGKVITNCCIRLYESFADSKILVTAGKMSYENPAPRGISILASLLKVHSFLPICQPPFLSEMTAQGPAYCIPVRADEPGPPFDQRPIGSVSGFEREGKNQKNMEELGR
jgi:hypothetical protein